MHRTKRPKSRKRGGRRIVVAHVAHSFEEAEEWDLDYWLSLDPESRIEALEELRREVEEIWHERNKGL